jgi:hypothetical protein
VAVAAARSSAPAASARLERVRERERERWRVRERGRDPADKRDSTNQREPPVTSGPESFVAGARGRESDAIDRSATASEPVRRPGLRSARRVSGTSSFGASAARTARTRSAYTALKGVGRRHRDSGKFGFH